MKTSETKLFIVNPDERIGARIKLYIKRRFGNRISASVFSDGKECVRHVDKDTDLVVLTDLPKDQHSLGILKLIKCMNWKTEVIILPRNEDAPRVIQQFVANARGYLAKRKESRNSFYRSIKQTFMGPARAISKQFKLPVGLSVFLLTFVCTAVILSFFFLLLRAMEGGR
jgi:DNA-binding NtrC family response regulator